MGRSAIRRNAEDMPTAPGILRNRTFRAELVGPLDAARKPA
jgi:hypothetical protein